ncbi:MAG: Fe-S cluster assembly protein NifU [Nitrospirota bacterium]
MWEYTEKLKELFRHPKNVGEIENPDAVGEVGSMICGDALKLTLKIDKETNRIIDAKFQTFGCASAIATSSALTEIIKGKTVEEALKITNKDVAEYIGGVPKEKMHCSVMCREALEAAIASYKGERKPLEEKEKLVCQCFEVTEDKIRRVAIENHLTTVEEITNYTKAGGGCGSCIPRIEEILKDIWAIKVPEMPKIKKRLTNLQKIALIQDVIEKEIRPRLQADGGDLELIDIDGNRVIIALRAMCVECPMGGVTVNNIQEKLRELVDENIVVEVG